jgi:hypothetical protein
MPSQGVLDEIDREVDVAQLEATLMSEGTAKFADPHKALLKRRSSKGAPQVDRREARCPRKSLTTRIMQEETRRFFSSTARQR